MGLLFLKVFDGVARRAIHDKLSFLPIMPRRFARLPDFFTQRRVLRFERVEKVPFLFAVNPFKTNALLEQVVQRATSALNASHSRSHKWTRKSPWFESSQDDFNTRSSRRAA